MIILTLDTEHFHFQAAGEKQAEAENALEAALAYHAEQYGLKPEWSKDYEISSFEIHSGEAFRDGQLLYRKN